MSIMLLYSLFEKKTPRVFYDIQTRSFIQTQNVIEASMETKHQFLKLKEKAETKIVQ